MCKDNAVGPSFRAIHDMGAEIGTQFDRGLLALKAVSEAEAQLQAEEMAKKAAAETAAAQAAADKAAAQAEADAAAAAKKQPKAHR